MPRAVGIIAAHDFGKRFRAGAPPRDGLVLLVLGESRLASQLHVSRFRSPVCIAALSQITCSA